MPGRRIDFPKDDAAKFNELRDRWRSVAAGCALSRSGLRVATVLPAFLSRESGYAFPTDEQLMAEIHAAVDSVKRGLNALEKADLIERETRVKRDEKGEAIGRLRRVYLTMPDPMPKIAQGSRGEGAPCAEVKVQEVKVHPEVKGQKRIGEGADGGTNIPDTYTPDTETRRDDRKVGVYARAKPAPSPRTAPSPPRTNPNPTPPSWGSDMAFLDEFDRRVRERTAGKEIGAGEIERIIQEAFDGTTDSTDDFMPVHWRDILALRTSEIAEWFRWRGSSIAHERLREAA